jgi:hypothetical protein
MSAAVKVVKSVGHRCKWSCQRHKSGCRRPLTWLAEAGLEARTDLVQRSDGLLEEDLFVDCKVQRVKVKLCSWSGLVDWAIADRKLGRFDGSVEPVA